MLSPHQARYVERYLSTRAGFRVEAADLSPADAALLFETLSRAEEAQNTIRDQWGNWDWQYCDSQRRGDVYRPWLDERAGQIVSALAAKKSETVAPPWPAGKKFALCLTHDVDIVSTHSWREQIRRLQRLGRFRPRQALGSIRNLVSSIVRETQRALTSAKDALWHYEDWLKLEDSCGMKSTFYFFPTHLIKPHTYDCLYSFSDTVVYRDKAQTVSSMMKEMSKAGWEVGLHGSYHSATTENILRHEREDIEGALGERIMSTRQHWLHYDVRMTPRFQHDAGLKTDSTQGFNRSIGFRAGTAFPYWTWDWQNNMETQVLQIPQHIMDGALFTSNALEYDETLATKHCLNIMDEVERIGGCLTLSWHPNYLNDPKWWNVYKTLLQEGARRGAWGCTARELYERWVKREPQPPEP